VLFSHGLTLAVEPVASRIVPPVKGKALTVARQPSIVVEAQLNCPEAIVTMPLKPQITALSME